MKGGVGASYNKDGNNIDKLNELSKISIDFYDFTTKKNMHKTFLQKEIFYKFLNDNNFGIKIFRNNDEFNQERIKLIKLITSVNTNFLKKYTCLAINNDKIYYSILNTNLIIFSNCDGNMKSTGDIAKYIKIDPFTVFEKLYTKSFDFLITLHTNDLYYGDLKCDNIFINLLKNYDSQIIIGDIGSIIFYGDFYNEIENYNKRLLSIRNYTFMDPSNKKFIHFWTTGKGSKMSLTKKLNIIKPNLFSEENIKNIEEIWASSIKIPPDNELYDYNFEVEYFLANAIDWFHFGIAMIQFIVNHEILYEYIDIIFDFFCKSPLIFDKNINFNCIINNNNNNESITKKIKSF